jgi:tRNA dimethylallyltransferase
VAPPIALLGPTASGKSAVALAVARAHPGVGLVSVDSMQVYRGMDIGTAKPTPAERAEVPHHLLDLVDPAEEFTVAEFQRAAKAALADIDARGGRALLVGGTGLHHRAVIDDLDIPGRWPDLRAELEREADEHGAAGLHARLAALDPLAASRMDPENARRVVRALEVTLGSGRPFSSYGPGLADHGASAVMQVGLDVAPDELAQRIESRVERMFADGLVEEVRALPPLGRTAAQALGYKEVLLHLAGELTLDEAMALVVRRTRRFARRQQKWFGRDPRIRWVRPDHAYEVLVGLLDPPD